jgi:hypothetical protein
MYSSMNAPLEAAYQDIFSGAQQLAGEQAVHQALEGRAPQRPPMPLTARPKVPR